MIKVCTFNLRINNAGYGINCFDNRFERIVDVIKNECEDQKGDLK